MKKRLKAPKMNTLTLTTTLCALLILAAPPTWAKPPEEVRTSKYERVKAYVIDNNPKTFTIDVYSFANIMVDQEAPAFAVYISTSPPKTCADFTSVNLDYTRPEKYHRQFDLTKHQDIQDALEKYRCVVIKNIPQ